MENRENLLNAIWEYQMAHGHLDQHFFEEASKRFGISEVEIEGVASFYHFFHQKPQGKHVIYVNNSIVSEIKGYDRIIEAFERETGARLGSTDPTGTFSLYSTSCIGLSDHEPAALIDFHPFTHLTGMKVKKIVQEIKACSTSADLADEVPSNQRLRPASDKAIFFREHVPGKSLSRLFDVTPDAFIGMLKEFRKKCKVLVSAGECAIWGGVPAMRNTVPLEECLEEAYLNSVTTDEGEDKVPYQEDLPKLLDKVYGNHELVKIDHHIPGCPPSADVIWKSVANILWDEDQPLLCDEVKFD